MFWFQKNLINARAYRIGEANIENKKATSE
jgi:hypothetical protein